MNQSPPDPEVEDELTPDVELELTPDVVSPSDKEAMSWDEKDVAGFVSEAWNTNWFLNSSSELCYFYYANDENTKFKQCCLDNVFRKYHFLLH